MPLQIVRADITKIACDAIVNAAKHSLLGGGGVDGAIHAAAGPELLEECRSLGGCATGEAKLTQAYNLPSKYVIHTVGPVWQGGNQGEPELLRACYENSYRLAVENACQSVAFPLISAGTFGYPKEDAFRLAVDVLGRFALESDLTIYLVVFGHTAFEISQKLFSYIRELIDDNYASTNAFGRSCWLIDADRGEALRHQKNAAPYDSSPASCPAATAPKPCSTAPSTAKSRTKPSIDLHALKRILKSMDESFAQMLLRKIDESGMTDAQCYKKANIDRKLFSKIRNDTQYKPSKPTVLAFAIALELDMAETQDMLKKAGYAFSPANRFDIVVEYFINHGNYNIFEINEALFVFDLPLLGG